MCSNSVITSIEPVSAEQNPVGGVSFLFLALDVSCSSLLLKAQPYAQHIYDQSAVTFMKLVYSQHSSLPDVESENHCHLVKGRTRNTRV
jgi:hypothetical protein